MKFVLVFLSVILSIFGQISADPERYVYSLVKYDSSVKFSDNIYLCYCTAISERHLLLPATCAEDVKSPIVLGVAISYGIITSEGVSASTSTSNDCEFL